MSLLSHTVPAMRPRQGHDSRMRSLLPLLLLPLLGCPAGPPCEDEACLVSDGLSEGLLSVRVGPAGDVWVAGADGGGGPTLATWDAMHWTFIDTAALAGQELWWVHPLDELVVAVGSGGLIVEIDRASATATRIEGPSEDITFFGVWGDTSDDLWAVGGAVGGGMTPRIWRRDGAGAWSRYIDPTLGEGAEGEIYFKVNGTAADDLWIVGNRGLALHWDGASLTETDTGSETSQLLSVDVIDGDPVAAGGSGAALILRWDGSAWQDESPEFEPAMNGVCAGGGQGFAVGAQGSIDRYVDGVWETSLDALTLLDYHSCVVDADGGFWAVGGSIASRPLDEGLLVYQGSDEPDPLR